MKWLVIIFLLFPSIAAADLLKSVNDRVNREVTYITDQALHGKSDVWDIAGRFGDCESIALKKLSELRETGIDGLIGVYFDDEWKTWHAVLIVSETILDGKRRFWHRRATICLAASERFAYKARIGNGAAWMVEQGGKPIDPVWIRKIYKAKGI